MEIIRMVFGELANNCYIVYNENSLEAYVIDPGYQAKKIFDTIKKRRFQVKGIILTHFHYDHADASDELRKLTGAPVFIHRKDVKRLKAHHDVAIGEGHVFALSRISAKGNPRGSKDSAAWSNAPATASNTAATESIKRFEQFEQLEQVDPAQWEILEVIHTPGHSKGSICLINRHSKDIFTGDTIFPTDTGYVTFEGGSGEEMMASMKRLDGIITDDYMIWPGHEDNVSMSYVRKHNAEFRSYLEGIVPDTANPQSDI